MFQDNKIDPVSEPALEALEYIVEIIWDEFKLDLHSYEDFIEHSWFWTEIMKRGLLKYLDLSEEVTLASSAKSLIYAYTYPGTREGLIQLAHGIFGSHSLVYVEDDKKPAVLSIKITNANESTLLVLGKDLQTALGTENRKYALAFWDVTRIILHDTKFFFKQFMTPGRVLESVTVEVD